MSRTTEAPIALTDFDSGIGRELRDLRGLAVLVNIAVELRNELELDADEREDLFTLILHTVDRLDRKVREVEDALLNQRRPQAAD